MDTFTYPGRLLLLEFCLTIGAVGFLRAQQDAAPCGDDQITCGQDDKCCEHVVAMFSSDGASAPPYVEGLCVPREQHCGDYWCGNRHCQAGFFGSQSVCCVTNSAGAEPEYRCAYSELSCPGNTHQLTIRDRDRDKLASRPLQGS